MNRWPKFTHFKPIDMNNFVTQLQRGFAEGKYWQYKRLGIDRKRFTDSEGCHYDFRRSGNIMRCYITAPGRVEPVEIEMELLQGLSFSYTDSLKSSKGIFKVLNNIVGEFIDYITPLAVRDGDEYQTIKPKKMTLYNSIYHYNELDLLEKHISCNFFASNQSENYYNQQINNDHIVGDLDNFLIAEHPYVKSMGGMIDKSLCIPPTVINNNALDKPITLALIACDSNNIYLSVATLANHPNTPNFATSELGHFRIDFDISASIPMPAFPNGTTFYNQHYGFILSPNANTDPSTPVKAYMVGRTDYSYLDSYGIIRYIYPMVVFELDILRYPNEPDLLNQYDITAVYLPSFGSDNRRMRYAIKESTNGSTSDVNWDFHVVRESSLFTEVGYETMVGHSNRLTTNFEYDSDQLIVGTTLIDGILQPITCAYSGSFSGPDYNEDYTLVIDFGKEASYADSAWTFSSSYFNRPYNSITTSVVNGSYTCIYNLVGYEIQNNMSLVESITANNNTAYIGGIETGQNVSCFSCSISGEYTGDSVESVDNINLISNSSSIFIGEFTVFIYVDVANDIVLYEKTTINLNFTETGSSSCDPVCGTPESIPPYSFNCTDTWNNTITSKLILKNNNVESILRTRVYSKSVSYIKDNSWVDWVLEDTVYGLCWVITRNYDRGQNHTFYNDYLGIRIIPNYPYIGWPGGSRIPKPCSVCSTYDETDSLDKVSVGLPSSVQDDNYFIDTDIILERINIPKENINDGYVYNYTKTSDVISPFFHTTFYDSNHNIFSSTNDYDYGRSVFCSEIMVAAYRGNSLMKILTRDSALYEDSYSAETIYLFGNIEIPIDGLPEFGIPPLSEIDSFFVT